jgi:hypothetical protein
MDTHLLTECCTYFYVTLIKPRKSMNSLTVAVPRGVVFSCVFFGKASVYLWAIHFHMYWCKNLGKIVLPRESLYQKVTCLGGWLPPPYISAPRRDRKEISKATPMFSGSSYPMRLTGMLYDQTSSGKSKMAASKPEVSISRLVDMIGTQWGRGAELRWGPGAKPFIRVRGTLSP